MTRAQLAERLGTTRARVIGIEQGKTELDFRLVQEVLAELGLVMELRPDPSRRPSDPLQTAEDNDSEDVELSAGEYSTGQVVVLNRWTVQHPDPWPAA